MGCPQCQSDNISDSGICLACGYVTSIGATAQESVPETDNSEAERDMESSEPASETENSQSKNHSGLIEVEFSEEEPKEQEQEEKPAWRQELSQRLQAIKQKRDAMGVSRQPPTGDKIPYVPVQRTHTAPPPLIAPMTRAFESAPVRKPVQKPSVPPPRQKTLQPLSLGLSGERPAPKTAEPRNVRDLIDSAVSVKSSNPADPVVTANFPGRGMELPSDDEGKLILLSRTLSGLIDLIIILLGSGICIIAADFFSGIIALDTVSYLILSVLFLLTYFFYSLFFLSSTNQTVGMMITDLRVVDADGKRPSISQLLRRCFGHLASMLVLGFGLFWSLFDRDNQCFHDRISDTRVVRL